MKQPLSLDTDKYADVFTEYKAIKRGGLKIEFPQSPKDVHPLLKHTQSNSILWHV
jgi:hypothetical protein